MVTIKIKEDSKQAKAFIALAKTLSFVKFEETETESPYDNKFVKKIKRSEKSARGKKLIRVNPDNIWENI
ncbi:MAG: DUF2683 family protein [Gillisia sp.]